MLPKRKKETALTHPTMCIKPLGASSYVWHHDVGSRCFVGFGVWSKWFLIYIYFFLSCSFLKLGSVETEI